MSQIARLTRIIPNLELLHGPKWGILEVLSSYAVVLHCGVALWPKPKLAVWKYCGARNTPVDYNTWSSGIGGSRGSVNPPARPTISNFPRCPPPIVQVGMSTPNNCLDSLSFVVNVKYLVR